MLFMAKLDIACRLYSCLQYAVREDKASRYVKTTLCMLLILCAACYCVVRYLVSLNVNLCSMCLNMPML